MNSHKNYIYFLSHLAHKHRLSMRNETNDEEVWYMYLSPLRAFFALLAMTAILFVLILLLVAYTPILDLIPGNPGTKSRQMLVENILRLDSLDRELNYMRIYGDNVQLIMEGKTPVVRTMKSTEDSIVSQKTLIAPSREDSLLRAQMQNEGIYQLVQGKSDKNKAVGLEFIRPVNGEVVAPFNPSLSNFGVRIRPASSQQVLAVQDGTVIMTVWSAEEGYVTAVQHSGNFLSLYKHNSQLLKQTGSRVKSGEVLGYISLENTAEPDEGELVFELWYDGQAVDPQKYIEF